MAEPERLHVTAPEGDYDIFIEPGLLDRIPTRVTGIGLGERIIVATNTTLAPLYGERLAATLPNATVVTMPDGEQYKTLDTVAQLYADFAAAGLDRVGTVIALGGGVVGDTVGFAAATYMRGIRLIQMPTTLLSMVDSSVGGKVGVDLPQGKNLVGSFKQPDAVLVDPLVLATLPVREWRCGMAETIKHGFLNDPALLDLAAHSHYHSAEDDTGRFTSIPVGETMQLVKRAIQVKIRVVEADPYEHGVRATLNLGHTFAHAVERVTHYGWLHGEAVGVGLVAAARLSYKIGLCDSDLPGQVEEVVRDIGLPTRFGDLDPQAVYAAMATDKKWQSGKSRFILLRAIGQPEIVSGVDPVAVLEVLESMK